MFQTWNQQVKDVNTFSRLSENNCDHSFTTLLWCSQRFNSCLSCFCFLGIFWMFGWILNTSQYYSERWLTHFVVSHKTNCSLLYNWKESILLRQHQFKRNFLTVLQIHCISRFFPSPKLQSAEIESSFSCFLLSLRALVTSSYFFLILSNSIGNIGVWLVCFQPASDKVVFEIKTDKNKIEMSADLEFNYKKALKRQKFTEENVNELREKIKKFDNIPKNLSPKKVWKVI